MVHVKVYVVVTDDAGRELGFAVEEIKGREPLDRVAVVENGVGVARKALWDAYDRAFGGDAGGADGAKG